MRVLCVVLFCFLGFALSAGQIRRSSQGQGSAMQTTINSSNTHTTRKNTKGNEEEEEQKGNKQSSSTFARATPAPLAPTTCVHWKEEAKTHTRTHTHTEQYRPPACVPSKGGTTTLPVFTPRLLFLFCPFFFFWYSARTTARATHPPQQASSRLVSLTVPQNTQRKKVRGEQGQAQANKQASTKQTTKQTTQQQQPEN